MLRVESDGPLLRVTLNRPEVKNAFNDELIAELHKAFAGVRLGETRVVVLAGEGDAFCAGGDLQWMKKAASYTEEQNYEDALKLAKLFQAMVDCPAVIIARVQGAAFGGGCGLVSASDVAIAGEKALFAFSEVRLGLVPATISPFVIPKIGQGHARALFATGEAFGAEHALRIGLVHEVSQDLDASIDKKIKTVLSAGPHAVAKAKALGWNQPLDLESASRLLASVRAGDEGKEGVAAFLEKRKATFVVSK
jgi:enoyl-CoA hydratase/carnithine racemase